MSFRHFFIILRPTKFVHRPKYINAVLTISFNTSPTDDVSFVIYIIFIFLQPMKFRQRFQHHSNVHEYNPNIDLKTHNRGICHNIPLSTQVPRTMWAFVILSSFYDQWNSNKVHQCSPNWIVLKTPKQSSLTWYIIKTKHPKLFPGVVLPWS